MVANGAGLGIRVKAFAFDYVILAAYIGVLVGIGVWLGAAAPDLVAVAFANPVVGQFSGFLTLTLPVSLYFTLTESSLWQASWGKRRVGLKVTDARGQRLRWPRALGRTLLKFIPWELAHTAVWHLAASGPTPPSWLSGVLLVVWLLVGWNAYSIWRGPKHQAIHDRLAGTQVLVASRFVV